MEKYTRVQVEILLTADEKALLDHYVKEQKYRDIKNAEQPGTGGHWRNCYSVY